MFSKPLLVASLALSSVAAADAAVDATVISKHPYYDASTNTGLNLIVKTTKALGLTDYAVGQTKNVYGCAQCIMAGLEAWYEPASASAHGDKWNTVFKTATPPTMLCCLPGAALAKATSCDPTGHTELVKMAAAYGTGDVLKSSSRTWKTPEVAILNCPIEEELCGAKKVVTVTSTKASLTMGDKSIDWTKDKTNCSWVLKSACKPIVVGYDATSTITAATKSDGVYVQWVQIPQASVTSDKVGQFTFTKAQLLSTTAAKSALYQFTQKYSSGGSTAAFTRDFPVELAALWAAQWNAQVPAYKTAVEDYDKEVKNFNLVHAQTALGKTNTKAKEELATYLTGLTTFLKTTAEPSTASTVKKLPEYPSVAVARPLAWAGPKLIAEADAAKAAVDDYYPSAMGGGKALTGILPLAADKHQGFGTNGAGKLAEVVNFSVDHMTAASVKDDTVCKDTYVGIIAVAKEAAKSQLLLDVQTGEWTKVEAQVLTALPAAPTKPLAREAAQYLAAGAASIALVAASLY